MRELVGCLEVWSGKDVSDLAVYIGLMGEVGVGE